MQFVQPLLTVDQASKVEQALKLVTAKAEDLGITWTSEEEENEYLQLAGFFQIVNENPANFRPAPAVARTVKAIVRSVKGPAQPPSGKSKRSQGQQKRARELQRKLVAEYNAARKRVEQDMQEAREAAAEQLRERQDRLDQLLWQLTAADAPVHDPRGEVIELLELIGANGLAAQAKALANEEVAE